ncbi:uncharacterized protein DS421_10g302740 [Arachis hypogaea]|nr:uncharacterized protein DS421_10g302740 [Arachis hypogaea]
MTSFWPKAPYILPRLTLLLSSSIFERRKEAALSLHLLALLQAVQTPSPSRLLSRHPHCSSVVPTRLFRGASTGVQPLFHRAFVNVHPLFRLAPAFVFQFVFLICAPSPLRV